MERGRERHLFPGNNTPEGFYSYYHYILPQREANHIFCMKGGPGVGKSTFMKRIGIRMQDMGYAVEYLHCSSDPDSLDGIVIPKLRAAMIDGTAPHVVDPKNPGAVDEIINLGEYWNLRGIKKNKEEVIDINEKVGLLFKRAYRYIAASKQLFDDTVCIYDKATDYSGLSLEIESVKDKIFREHGTGKLGKVRKQFASAITPLGLIHYLDTLYDDTYEVYTIKNHWGIGVNRLLKRISEEAIIRGFNTELYYNPMEPKKGIEHVVIPCLKKAFITQNKYLCVKRHNHVIDLAQYTDDNILENERAAIDFDTKQYEIMLNKGISTIKTAKQTHDDMEKYYIPNMDFDAVKKKMHEVLARMLEYAEED